MIKFAKIKLSKMFKTKSKQTKAYELARSHLGLREKKGKAQHEARILQFFKDVGHGWVKEDEVAWCSAFAGAMLEYVGLESTRKLDARSYLKWGQEVQKQDAKEGDIVVFWRGTPNGWQGHVAFFVRWTESGDIVCLGGNQSDQVSEQVYSKERLLGFRRAAE